MRPFKVQERRHSQSDGRLRQVKKFVSQKVNCFLIRGLLLNPQEHLPVRVEAAIALNQFVCQQHKIAQYMTQSLKEILEGSVIPLLIKIATF